MDYMSQEPTEDCLIVNMISTCMYHAIHGSHVSGTDRRLSSSQHDKYMYVSCHSWSTCHEDTEDCLIVNMISACMYHAIHGAHVRKTQKIIVLLKVRCECSYVDIRGIVDHCLFCLNFLFVKIKFLDNKKRVFSA